MNFALFKDVNEEGPFHFLSGHGLEVRIQTLMCSYCITSQLMVTCLYVLGLIERFISCQQLQVIEESGDFGALQKDPTGTSTSGFSCFHRLLDTQVRELRFSA